jgi:hypothetical protein
MKVLQHLAGLAVIAVLASCAEPVPPRPLTLPAADGRAARLYGGDGFYYIVNYQGLEQAGGKIVLRVTRDSAPELTYSDGLVAKRVAETYCNGYNRVLNPSAFGQFSTPASWVFEWGCR